MKTLFTAVTILVLASAAQAEDWPPASEYTYETTCGHTKAPDNCLSNIKSFSTSYEKAIQGDYDGQRIVATAFFGGWDGVAQRPTLACAWSHVLLNSGHLMATPDDINNNSYYCDRLKPNEKTLAAAQAQRMLKMLGQ